MADLAIARRFTPERSSVRFTLPGRLRAWQRLLRRQRRLARLAGNEDVGGRQARRNGFDRFLFMVPGRQL